MKHTVSARTAASLIQTMGRSLAATDITTGYGKDDGFGAPLIEAIKELKTASAQKDAAGRDRKVAGLVMKKKEMVPMDKSWIESGVQSGKCRNARMACGLVLLLVGLATGLSGQVAYTPAAFSAGGAITATGMNTMLNGNNALINAQLTKLDSANWSTTASGIVYSGGNIGLGGNKNIGMANDVPSGQASYDGKTMGIYAIGWYLDSWMPTGNSCWLAGYGGIKLFTGSGLPRLSIDYAGNVGIGITVPAVPLDVKANVSGYAAQIYNANTTTTGGTNGNGTVLKIRTAAPAGYATTLLGFYDNADVFKGSIWQNNVGAIQYTTGSDRRLKENIVDTHYTVADLMKIQVRDFNFKKDARKTLVTGFIAQELLPIVPGAVAVPAKPEDFYSVDYGQLTPLLVKSAQDQQKRIDGLEKTNAILQADNAALKKQNDELAKRLAVIEKQLGLQTP